MPMQGNAAGSARAAGLCSGSNGEALHISQRQLGQAETNALKTAFKLTGDAIGRSQHRPAYRN